MQSRLVLSRRALGRVVTVGERGDLAIFQDELVAVGWQRRHRHPEGLARLVEPGPDELEDTDAAVVWQDEECGLVGVGRPDGEPISPTGLLELEEILEVVDRSLGYFRRLNEPGGALLYEGHWVERRLQ